MGSWSEIKSIVSSLEKRHGSVIENAIIAALRQCSDYSVWQKPALFIPDAADHVAQSQTLGESRATQLPYTGIGRRLQVDLIAFRKSTGRLGCYEIKRAHGKHDRGKQSQMLRDALTLQMVIASYGERRLGLPVVEAISRGIFYYGELSLPKSLSLIGFELDDHFCTPVRCMVEAATDYMRVRAENYLSGIEDLRPEMRQLVLEGIR